jgi:putative peptidoglycan lipid II flippase
VTPVKASLAGLGVNLALKVALMGALAQVGLALATAVGAWINLLLVIGFAMRAGYFEVDRSLRVSLGKFLVAGLVLAAVLWFTARFASAQFAHWSTMRDEAALGLLIIVGALVYAGAILLLFGPRWLKALVRA